MSSSSRRWNPNMYNDSTSHRSIRDGRSEVVVATTDGKGSQLPDLQHLMLSSACSHTGTGIEQHHHSSSSRTLDIDHHHHQNHLGSLNMKATDSPAQHPPSSSLFLLLNDDAGPSTSSLHGQDKKDQMVTDDTPRPADLSRFEDVRRLETRSSGPSAPPPSLPHLQLERGTELAPLRFSAPRLLRHSSDSLSEPESATSAFSHISRGDSVASQASVATDYFGRSYSTVSTASSRGSPEFGFRSVHAHPRSPLAFSSGAISPKTIPVDVARDPLSEQRPPSSSSRPATASSPAKMASRAPISRSTKACNACRSRKVRCDAGGQAATLVGNELPCTRCKDAGITCVYSANQRKRGPTPGMKRASARSKENADSKAAPSKRPSAINIPRRDSETPTYSRTDTRPAPYRTNSLISPLPPPPSSSASDYILPHSASSRERDPHLSLDPLCLPRPNTLPSPLWSSHYTPSASSLSSSHSMHHSLFGGPSHLIVTPPLHPMDSHSGQDSPSIMGWTGSQDASHPRYFHDPQSFSPRGSYTTYSSRSSAEAEAFNNGYSMALAQFQRQHDVGGPGKKPLVKPYGPIHGPDR